MLSSVPAGHLLQRYRCLQVAGETRVVERVRVANASVRHQPEKSSPRAKATAPPAAGTPGEAFGPRDVLGHTRTLARPQDLTKKAVNSSALRPVEENRSQRSPGAGPPLARVHSSSSRFSSSASLPRGPLVEQQPKTRGRCCPAR
jgi:hypothetical protein